MGMKLIQYTDNDALHKPATRGEQVYAVESALISKAAIIEKYATVFGDGIGELEGEYQIRLDDAVDPIQHAPRRVPVALRDRLKATLDDMTRDDIIEAVEKPTAWITSMVVITKKDSNDTDWMWESSQQNAVDTLKKAVASTPVLRYYNLADEVTIQCDASQSGLGAALMQNGQSVAYESRALTPPETRYAQIEKELLAIVFACDRFEAYIYGRDRVSIESDHKPLETIVLKPLSSAPKRLQRMLLRLQKYTLDVKFKKGEHMYLADTLSRAYIPEVKVCDFVHELEELDHRESLPVSQERWQQLNHASENDYVFQQLRATIQNGWPETKAEVPECVLPYYDSRDELTVQGNLIFKGQLLVVPAAVRTELMSVAHASHIGIEGCLR